MKTIIGTLSLYPPRRIAHRFLDGYLCKEAIRILGKEIVLDIEHKTIRRASMFDNHTFCTKNSTLTFTPKGEWEDYVGVYNIIQKDEDTFILKKQKHV